ncbi:MAG: hypothetical protein D6744_05690 [Planctomycetota bacterium]|nr:MAG: hypothetical protein D6744_05690 [Planctomycetota bacterium]
MLIDSFDTEQRVLIVAEIGNNHEGDFTVAEELIARAAEAGADAVKFQTFQTEHYVRPIDADRFARLKQFELTQDQFARLAERARQAKVLFVSTPFDLASARFLASHVSALKIASGDNNFTPLLKTAAATGKPLILSTGLADLATIRLAVATIERVWSDTRRAAELAIMHCVSAYPVPPEQANLAAIATLRREFGLTVGYSDHASGIDAAVLSVAAGARIVEKHFTLDKQYSDFRDHQLSADPPELRELVRRIREAEAMLGDGGKRVQPCESDARLALRRSIAVGRDLPAGTILRWEHLTWLRPGDGLAPGRENELLGRRLTRDIKRGSLIGPHDVE